MDAKDFKLDTEGDIDIIRGDFPVVESDQTHINHILISNKGYFFETPLLGVGIIQQINGSAPRQVLKQEIRRQLVFDNYNVQNITISDDYEIDINAVRRI